MIKFANEEMMVSLYWIYAAGFLMFSLILVICFILLKNYNNIQYWKVSGYDYEKNSTM